MSEIKIEKSIPIPEKNRNKSIISTMQIGDSFFTAADDKTILETCAVIGALLNFEFTMETEGRGTRVWRVA